MDLTGRLSKTGRLSNPDLMALLQRLTTHDWKQAPQSHRSASGPAPDGRRKFGTVRDAIIEVLAQAGSEVRVKDIQNGVEQILIGSVSTSSVKDYLRRGADVESHSLSTAVDEATGSLRRPISGGRGSDAAPRSPRSPPPPRTARFQREIRTHSPGRSRRRTRG